MDWLDDTCGDSLTAGPAFSTGEFRELRPRIPADPRYQPRTDPAVSFLAPRHGADKDKPPIDLSPSTLERGRKSSLAKRKRNTVAIGKPSWVHRKRNTKEGAHA